MSDIKFRDELAKRFSYVSSCMIEPTSAVKVEFANSLLNAGIIETPAQYVEYIQTGSFTPIKRNFFQKILRFIKGFKKND